MRILMLGWDFSPQASGGVGVACRGLVRALTQAGIDVVFVQPHASGTMEHSGARVLGIEKSPPPDSENTWSGSVDESADPESLPDSEQSQPSKSSEDELPPATRVLRIPADLAPYDRPLESVWSPSHPVAATIKATGVDRPANGRIANGPTSETQNHSRTAARATEPPQREVAELLEQVQRYASRVVEAGASIRFDLIHAHDWMSFPAGQRLAAATHRPLIAHVHSTEFDRSPFHIDQSIYDVERAGVEQSDAVIAVSHLTGEMLVRRYSVSAQRIQVIYSALDLPDAPDSAESGESPELARAQLLPRLRPEEKIVLFLGRITMQKGPEYFLAAAQRVLHVEPDVRFVMAGSGDMVAPCMKLARQLDIADRVLFTGFLQPDDVRRVFRCADLYVMPSVAEPYGIATLEAVSHDVPVLISRQSGIGEVLRDVLRADFWDTDEMANKIVAVLRHPPLHATLRQRARFELRRLTWDHAAAECITLYERVLRCKDTRKPGHEPTPSTVADQPSKAGVRKEPPVTS